MGLDVRNRVIMPTFKRWVNRLEEVLGDRMLQARAELESRGEEVNQLLRFDKYHRRAPSHEDIKFNQSSFERRRP